MPSRMLCKGVQQGNVKACPDLASGGFCYAPLHNIWYSTGPPVTCTRCGTTDIRKQISTFATTEGSLTNTPSAMLCSRSTTPTCEQTSKTCQKFVTGCGRTSRDKAVM